MLVRTCIAAALASWTASAAYLSASDPMVLWQGRPTPNSVDGSVAFDWEGTSCSFSVAGVGANVTAYINVTLPNDHVGRLQVQINDYDAQNLLLHSGASTYLIAAGLNYPVNNITLHYGLEPGMSGAGRPAGRFVAINGFEVGLGGSFVPTAPLKRRIDIIGDSITAGSGYDHLESVNGQLSFETGCNPWAPSLGNSQAYNWETYLTRYLRANTSVTAWSGGVLVNPAGTNCAGRAYLPQLYTQAFATSAAEPWDFSRWSRPDLVIVFLGTNDYSCNYTNLNARFTAAQVELMQNITNYYANSPPSPSGATDIQFLLTIGPMSPNAPLNATLNAIEEATAQGFKAGLLDMRNATLDGCGGHPGPVGHFQMAVEAAPQVKAVMGW